MNIDKEAASVARKFNARKARENTVLIWQQARRMTPPATRDAIRSAAEWLRESGIRDVRIEEVPSHSKLKRRRNAGNIPILTGTAGSGTPAVYLCAHLDGIGAQDNASGYAIAIEALRVLNHPGPSGRSPQVRAIRFFFSTNIRGTQMWLNLQEKPPWFIGGLNLNIPWPGRDPAGIIVGKGFAHRPHFASMLLPRATKIADGISKGIISSEESNFVSNGMFGTNYPGGRCSLEQKTGKTYEDTGKALRNNSLKWSGAATTAFLYMMSRARNSDLLELAESARRSDGAAKKKKNVSANRTLIQLRTIETAFRKPPRTVEGLTPEDYYRAGVDKATGLWPETVQLDKLRDRILAQQKKAKGFRKPVRRDDTPQWRNAAGSLVPKAKFRSCLSFEDHLDEQSIKNLQSRTGLSPSLGEPKWAWMLTSFFRGKQTLLEIIEHMRNIGLKIDMQAAVKITRYLAGINMVSLRPVITGKDIEKAFAAVGVKKGASVMLHASLSRFGYIRGGTETIIKSLRKRIGNTGTLIMPAHSLSILGRKPYRFDSESQVGAVSEYFRKLKGVARSAHPTHSVAALGPKALRLTETHDPDSSPFDRNGFWGRFYEDDGQVLLMCPVTSATVFHVGETWTGLPQRSCIAHSVAPNGRRKIHIIPNAPLHVGHFEKTMAAPLRRIGVLKKVPLGEDEIHCGPARKMIDQSVETNQKKPLVSIGKNGHCNCIFCRILKSGIRK